MTSLEETIAVGTGSPVKKVTLDGSIGSFIYIASGNSPMRDSTGANMNSTEPHELISIGSRGPKILVIPDYFQQHSNEPSLAPVPSSPIEEPKESSLNAEESQSVDSETKESRSLSQANASNSPYPSSSTPSGTIHSHSTQ